MENITLLSFDDRRDEIIGLLQSNSISFNENSSSNISGATITEIIIPIAAIILPTLIQIILELRKSSSRTIVKIHNITINIQSEENVEVTILNALNRLSEKDD